MPRMDFGRGSAPFDGKSCAANLKANSGFRYAPIAAGDRVQW